MKQKNMKIKDENFYEIKIKNIKIARMLTRFLYSGPRALTTSFILYLLRFYLSLYFNKVFIYKADKYL